MMLYVVAGQQFICLFRMNMFNSSVLCTFFYALVKNMLPYYC
uniref:Uncharacterized protein n=1 Tax=Rhizophora mucronata TaxID=61149 RepID=A0A2P2PJ28_RHIMU